MKLKGSLDKHKMLIGGLILGGLGLYAWKHFGNRSNAGPSAPPSAAPKTRSYIGYAGPKNPGLDNLDNYVHWVAAGHAAGLDPSPYSYLTERNENPLLSKLPYIELTGQGGTNFEEQKFQGSYGFVNLDPQAFFTYW